MQERDLVEGLEEPPPLGIGLIEQLEGLGVQGVVLRGKGGGGLRLCRRVRGRDVLVTMRVTPLHKTECFLEIFRYAFEHPHIHQPGT